MQNEYAIDVLEKHQKALEGVMNHVLQNGADKETLDKLANEYAELQSAIETLQGEVVGTYFIENLATSDGYIVINVPSEYWGELFQISVMKKGD